MSEESSNKKIIKLMRLTSQEQMILTYMEQFYKDYKNSRKLYKLLNGKTSIRLIDFFVTNYSKKIDQISLLLMIIKQIILPIKLIIISKESRPNQKLLE